MELVNLCFADDLFLFAYGDVGSASIIKEALDEFNLSFEEGKLPVKYLRVPLVSSRLMIRDCNELVDKVQIRIQDWKNKSLSIAGRLQLIHSILGSMHIYGASVFILPNHVLLNIEQLMRQFLWSHGSSGKGKSKVSWEIVCLPKHEGGLGIRRLKSFNSALMASHIWKLLTLKESLWRRTTNSVVVKLVVAAATYYVWQERNWRLFKEVRWHLEEIHVTWAHLEKKRTRLRTYTKSHEESCSRSGKFPGGLEVAVKRLSINSGQGLEEFKNEVTLIARLPTSKSCEALGILHEGKRKDVNI
nr:hypothetical protein [Tanacetum cinerariifolium]